MPNVDLVETTCWCGLPFAMPKRLMDTCQETGQKFFCPLGHTLSYTESEADKYRSEADKYRREAERLKQKLAQKDDEIRDERERTERERRSAAAYRGQVTKLQTRVKAGVCPCCTRHFTNVERHMATKHPEFDPAANVVPFEGKATAQTQESAPPAGA